MNKGTVKFFNDTKGFGFILEEGTGKEHFVHVSGLIDEINEGDNVEFELEEGKKGLNAVKVSVV
ncbi:MAG: cold shock domain-containing protein [Crocinitomix sp.]|nr:cold shock domain-containing protein [Crocinitomix sp.]|tara:strand:+ start:17803 stop:17994 length:192 start_codon:yes stop_codon:yes gene_type:complete